MKKLIPLVLILIGLGGGVAAGLVLKPGAAECDAAHEDDCAVSEKEDEPDLSAPTEFADFGRQFVVPIVKDDRVQALVVATLSVEMAEGEGEKAYAREPKLRDAFLNVLFVHAHSGGFDGAFTSRSAMADLKGRLVETAKPILGKGFRDVLITEIVRQDL
ncbi:flagellar basal body-associated FliL family protein [Halovulum sp. GXIMD14794]